MSLALRAHLPARPVGLQTVGQLLWTQATLEVDLGIWAAARAKAGTTGDAAEATTNLHGRGRRDPIGARG